MSEVLEKIDKKTLVPKLRFKEFDGEWKKSSLKNEAIVNPKTSEIPDNFIYIDLESVTKGMLIKEDEVTAKEAPSRAQRVLDEDDILFQTVRPYQKNNYYFNKVGNYVASTGYAQIKAKGDSKYLFQFLHTTRFVNIVNRWSTGTSYPAISPSELVKIPIALPTLPEQQKIASFLTSVDEKTQQLTRKKELLEQFKKGVMQRLFSGELRFNDKNGKSYSEWEVKRLGEIGVLKNGLNKDKKDFGFGSPFVNLMDVFGKRELNNQKFDLVNSDEKEKKLYNVLKGDVLFIRSSVKRTGVGEAVVVNEDLLNTVYSGFLIRFRDDREYLDQKFKKYCFASQSFRKELLSYATSSANTNINQESLNKIKVLIPSIQEQQKLANYLTSIDTKIELVVKELKATQSFKKGLLHQMFV